VSTWLIAIARHKALTALGRRSEVGLDDDMAASLVDPEADPERALQEKDRSKALGQCLAQLSPEHGRIITSFTTGKSQSVRSPRSSVSGAHSEDRMFYARRRIAELMKAHGTFRRGNGANKAA
jgi:RNA polymerase sigma-70 factor (ECF subfamily)